MSAALRKQAVAVALAAAAPLLASPAVAALSRDRGDRSGTERDRPAVPPTGVQISSERIGAPRITVGICRFGERAGRARP